MVINKTNPRFFISMHRSGSSILSKIIAGICMQDQSMYIDVTKFTTDELKKLNYYNASIVPIRIAEYNNRITDDIRDEILKHSGEKYNVICGVRDPRDVAVSMYYAFCYGHGRSELNQEDAVSYYIDKGVDKFVLDVIFGPKEFVQQGTGDKTTIKDRYELFLDKYFDKSRTLKYEDMVTNTEQWLRDITEYYNNINEDKFAKIVSCVKPLFNVNEEDITQQRRQVTPGDYKRKLKKETIDCINEKLKPILEKLEYEV